MAELSLGRNMHPDFTLEEGVVLHKLVVGGHEEAAAGEPSQVKNSQVSI